MFFRIIVTVALGSALWPLAARPGCGKYTYTHHAVQLRLLVSLIARGYLVPARRAGAVIMGKNTYAPA
ncbi:MAG: hypothetical protein SF053_14735 [Bacteroidia bacterium]|nr:hypothetical protein [Bacteroidia bacterium]